MSPGLAAVVGFVSSAIVWGAMWLGHHLWCDCPVGRRRRVGGTR